MTIWKMDNCEIFYTKAYPSTDIQAIDCVDFDFCKILGEIRQFEAGVRRYS